MKCTFKLRTEIYVEFVDRSVKNLTLIGRVFLFGKQELFFFCIRYNKL